MGEHRFAGTWTGDNVSEWEFLLLTVPQVLNMGLSAQPIAGSDIGGYGGESLCPPELLVRWTTLGAFLPWFRNHYGHGDGTKKPFQEPYRYGDEVASVCRKYIELRYKLLQVFYDAMHENHRTGMPIVRPLFMHSDDLEIYGHHDWWYWAADRGFHYNHCRLDDQFFLGKDLLLAPVLLPTEATGMQMERPVYLPAGSRWYSFKDNRFPLDPPVEGGQQFSYYAPWNTGHEPYLNTVPTYVREGAIIPHRELEQSVGERERSGRDNPITINIYPGPNGSYRLYLDDGLTTEAESQARYRLLSISHEEVDGGRTIRLHREHDNFLPRERHVFVAILDPAEPDEVDSTGDSGPRTRLTRIEDSTDEGAAERLAGSDNSAYYYNLSLRATFVKIADESSSATIDVRYGGAS